MSVRDIKVPFIIFLSIILLFFCENSAALDAVSFQTREILESMQADSKYELSSLLVDGGT